MEEVYINCFNAVSVLIHPANHMIAATISNVSSDRSGEEQWICLFVCLFQIRLAIISEKKNQKNP